MLHFQRRNKITPNSMRGSVKAYDLRENSGKKATEESEMSNNNSPRPFFNHHRRSNNNRSSNQNASCPPPLQQEHNDQHEEIVRYFVERWETVISRRSKHSGESDYVVYREKSPNPKMKDFKKFDLEGFISEHHHRKLINSVPTHSGGGSNSNS